MRRSHTLALVSVSCIALGALSAGCGEMLALSPYPAPVTTTAASPVRASATPAVVVSSPVPAAPAPPPLAPTKADAIPDPPRAAAAPAPPAPPAFDLDAWLARHGIGDAPESFGDEDGDLLADECRPMRVGAKHLDGVVCPRRRVDGSDLIVADEVWVVEHHKLRCVLRVPMRAAPLDAETIDARGAAVRLDVDFDPGGKAVEVHDDPAASCNQANARINDLAGHEKLAPLAAALTRETTSLCGARGRYVFSHGEFRRRGNGRGN